MTTSKEQDTIEVLDGAGFVRMDEYLGGDLSVVNSARVSFGTKREKLGKRDVKLINYLADNEHMSPFRHTYIKFHFRAPEYVARQLYKHSIGVELTSSEQFKDMPWNEISGRYVVLPPKFYTPIKFRKQSSDNKQASTDEEVADPAKCAWLYKEALNKSYDMYEKLLLEGVAKEQARGVLPVCFITEWYWTMSLEAAVHLVRLRDHKHAQYETRVYGKAVYELLNKIAPVSVAKLLER